VTPKGSTNRSKVDITQLSRRTNTNHQPPRKSKAPDNAPNFTPRINAISSDLDNRLRVLNSHRPTGLSEEDTSSRMPDGGSAKRWDTLYDLAMQKMGEMDARREARYYEAARAEMDEATFRPWINASSARGEFEGHLLDVAERNRVWNENKVKKIEALKAQRLQPNANEVRECTFRPQINKGSSANSKTD
jgi:hypothetical protein